MRLEERKKPTEPQETDPSRSRKMDITFTDVEFRLMVRAFVTMVAMALGAGLYERMSKDRIELARIQLAIAQYQGGGSK